jgi:RHS repeat-associated protein
MLNSSRHYFNLFASKFTSLVISMAIAFMLAPLVDANTCSTCEEEVKIAYKGRMCSHSNFSISLNGTSASGTAKACTDASWSNTSKVWVSLKPNQTYTLTAGTGICSTHIDFDVPSGYKLFIDDEESSTIDKGDNTTGSGDGTWNVVLRKDCPSCTGGPAAQCQIRRGSVIWEVGLGQLSNGRSAESISIQETNITSAIYTPSALVYSPPARSTEVDVVRDGSGNLRQVKAPQTLADIVTVSSTEYDIKFYKPSSVGSKVGGVYTLSGSPFATWKIKNPNSPSTNSLEISKIQGSLTETSQFTYDSTTSTWTLTTGSGERVETASSTVSGTDRTETTTVKNSSNQVVYKVRKVFRTYAWGEELLQEVVDPDTAALTTSYTYYETSSEEGRYRKVKSISYPDGSWVKYDYDSYGNLILVLKPWKDQALSTSTESNSHAIKYTYTNDDGVNVSLVPKIVDTVEEKVLGTRVKYTTFKRSSITVNSQTAVKEEASVYNLADSFQVTITARYYRTAPNLLAGRVAYIEYPDGRRETFTYEKGDYTSNTDPSLSQFTVNTSGLAERETVTHGTISSQGGIANRTLKETVVHDGNGNKVLEERHVFTGSAFERIEWTVSSYDDQSRLTRVDRSNGQYSTFTWDNDRKISQIDEYGTETTFSNFDGFARPRTVTKKGVAASGGYPAQVDIVSTFTFDPDGRLLTETVTGSTLSLSKSKVYDLAGRVSSETDNANLSTGFSYTNGGRTETITLPGGATRISDKFLDGKVKSITGTSVVTEYFDYGINTTDGTRYSQQYFGPSGLSSPRWVKTTIDWMDRTIKTERPTFTSGTNLVVVRTYNALGQLAEESTAAGTTEILADKVFEYDELGDQIKVGLDVDDGGYLTATSNDRYSDQQTVYEKIGSDWFRKTTSKTYLKSNDATAITRIEKERLTGFTTNGAEKTVSEKSVIDIAGNETKTTLVIDRAANKAITTIDVPDSATNSISVAINGLTQSASPSTPENNTTYTYDALGRQSTIVSPSSGTTTITYNSTTGQVASRTEGANTISYEYHGSTHVGAGRVKSESNAANKKVYFDYNSRGQVTKTWGDTTYPVENIYNDYAEQTELRTFRNGSGWTASTWPTATTGTADVTKWIYHAASGLLDKKEDNATKQTAYTYDGLGRAKVRTWARLSSTGGALTTTYSYDVKTGDLTSLDYSDSTPDVTFVYDRGGRRSNITDAAGAHTLTYNDAGELKVDQVAGGILDGIKVEVGYDSFLRRNSLQTTKSATTLMSQSYGYDTSSRLSTVTSGSTTATYGYNYTTGLFETTTYTGGTTVSRSYDSYGRLQSITNTPSGGGATSYTYTYNNLNQRTRVTREDNSYWSYGYNDRGELTSGKKYFSDNTVVAGQQNEYEFDNLGNRTSSKAGGDSAGTNLRTSNYTSNALNQYTQRTVPGYVSVTGTAASDATVTVNNESTYRKGNYFQKEIAVENAASPVHASINVVGTKNGAGANGEDAVTETTGARYISKATEEYTYDLDGNMLSDGRWLYTWDAENRLVSMKSVSSSPTTAKKVLEYAYDYYGRRIRKIVYVWNATTSSYQQQSVSIFIYNGWNLAAELDANKTLVRSYVWGKDLSGNLEGAGGIGGLLLVKDGATTHQTGYDANGNVTTLINASSGLTTASYEYDPLGNKTQSTGEYADRNPIQFSTKYTDSETGLTYYGYRYYNPNTGRWISRDPIQERGGINLYSYVTNDSVSNIDPFGLYDSKDFVKHYWFGGGETVDLGNVGLLDQYRRTASTSKAVAKFKSIIQEKAQKEASKLCTSCVSDKEKSSIITESNEGYTSVKDEPNLFALGRGTLNRMASCALYANCSERTYRVNCTLGFLYEDAFTDPLDGERINFPFDLPLSRPYSITGFWMEDFEHKGGF